MTGNRPGRVLDRGLDHQHVFFDRKRGRLAARADHDEPVRALLGDSQSISLRNAGRSETTVLVHRCDDGGNAAADLDAACVPFVMKRYEFNR